MTEITKMLVLSTGHLTRYACNTFLEEYPYAYPQDEWGYFVCLPTDELPLSDEHNLPACLIDCMKYADAQGCDWIMFDSDGPLIEELPDYEW